MTTPCPGNPPAPDGYQVWRGAVPKELTDWAVDIRNHINGFAYGTTWEKEYDGKSVVARKDYHTWTYRNGQLVTGICIPGVTLYSEKASSNSMGLVDTSTSTLNEGDPLSTPDESMSWAMFDADNAGPQGVNWGAVALTGAAALGVVGLFFAAIRYAGR